MQQWEGCDYFEVLIGPSMHGYPFPFRGARTLEEAISFFYSFKSGSSWLPTMEFDARTPGILLVTWEYGVILLVHNHHSIHAQPIFDGKQ